ncbi:hypothetical protein [Candidatus Borrarchaeum sp.]|uniref:hypothetical protein n=1 Tax=Candidatus Borrarchaeum sp. TaxID=2846742 RepID=UPI00257DB69C|nr:hypothetical protein [Candidatus Borrarchaeum sp.]
MKFSSKKFEGFLLPAIVGGIIAVILLSYMDYIDFTYARAHFLEFLIYIGLFEVVYLSGVAVWRYTSKFEATRTGRVMRDYAAQTAKHMDKTISNFTEHIPNLKQFNGLLDSFTHSFSEKINSVIQGLEKRLSEYVTHKLRFLDAKTNQLNESFEVVETIPGTIQTAISAIETTFKEYIAHSLSKVVSESIAYQQEISKLRGVITEVESVLTNKKLQLKETHTVLLEREEHITSLEGQLIDRNKMIKTKDTVIQEREAEVSRLKNEIIDSLEQLKFERREAIDTKEEKDKEQDPILNYAMITGISSDLNVLVLFKDFETLSPKQIMQELPDLKERTTHNVLSRLVEREMLTKEDLGSYVLTGKGRTFLGKFSMVLP